MDFGVRGFDPEPRGGYRLTKTRNHHLQAFSDATWQRHEAHHVGHPGPAQHWPGLSTFHSNWPLLAADLIVADWKIEATAAGTVVDWTWNGAAWLTEVDEVVLDPPPPPERDWRDTYAVELASRQAILQDLNTGGAGDGIELVLERAQLSSAERAVIRPYLYGIEIQIIAEDIGWRHHTVATLIRNALDRLHWLGENSGVTTTRGQRGNLIDREANARRARPTYVSGSAGSRSGAHPRSRAG